MMMPQLIGNRIDQPHYCGSCSTLNRFVSVSPLLPVLTPGTYWLCSRCAQLYAVGIDCCMLMVDEIGFLSLRITHPELFELILTAKEFIVLVPGNPYKKQSNG